MNPNPEESWSGHWRDSGHSGDSDDAGARAELCDAIKGLDAWLGRRGVVGGVSGPGVEGSGM